MNNNSKREKSKNTKLETEGKIQYHSEFLII